MLTQNSRGHQPFEAYAHTHTWIEVLFKHGLQVTHSGPFLYVFVFFNVWYNIVLQILYS